MQREYFNGLRKEVEILNANGHDKTIRYVRGTPTIVDKINNPAVSSQPNIQSTLDTCYKNVTVQLPKNPNN